VKTIEVLFSPAEFEALKKRELGNTICVVIDILRATSTIVTALGNGAVGIVPVETIEEALAWRKRSPPILLAGERDGVRISAALTGSIEFDLGNSPREFSEGVVGGRRIVMTTTNGTRALKACAHAQAVVAASLLNLHATAAFLRETDPQHLLLICSGTFDEASYEDTLAAGALCELLYSAVESSGVADSALMARELFQEAQTDLPGALALARNGRRLLARPELRDDVAFCARRDFLSLVAEMRNGELRAHADARA
jgi:2-phosphosulfolactate phosphatase